MHRIATTNGKARSRRAKRLRNGRNRGGIDRIRRQQLTGISIEHGARQRTLIHIFTRTTLRRGGIHMTQRELRHRKRTRRGSVRNEAVPTSLLLARGSRRRRRLNANRGTRTGMEIRFRKGRPQWLGGTVRDAAEKGGRRRGPYWRHGEEPSIPLRRHLKRAQ